MREKKKYKIEQPLKKVNWNKIQTQHLKENSFWVKVNEEKLASEDIFQILIENRSAQVTLKLSKIIVFLSFLWLCWKIKIVSSEADSLEKRQNVAFKNVPINQTLPQSKIQRHFRFSPSGCLPNSVQGKLEVYLQGKASSSSWMCKDENKSIKDGFSVLRHTY